MIFDIWGNWRFYMDLKHMVIFFLFRTIKYRLLFEYLFFSFLKNVLDLDKEVYWFMYFVNIMSENDFWF